MKDEDPNNSGLSRRELLRRGILLGGTVAWVTPVVQAVGMSAAMAAPPSPGCIRYAIKWEVDSNSPTGEFTFCDPAETPLEVWTNNWVGLGSGTGNCLAAPEGSLDDDGSAATITAGFKVYGDATNGFWVAYSSSCSLADLTDEAQTGSAASKCGATGCNILTKPDAGEMPDPCFPGLTRVFLGPCFPGGDPQISHVELIIDCCD